MAHPIAMIVALSRLVKVTCPHCSHKKSVERVAREFRVCPRCHRQFPDPLAKLKRR